MSFKGNRLGVQESASYFRMLRAIIGGVANQRMTQIGHMDPNLMPQTGLATKGDERKGAEAGQRMIFGCRLPTVLPQVLQVIHSHS